MAGGLVAEVEVAAGECDAEVVGGGWEYDGKDIVEHSEQVVGRGGLAGRAEEEVGVVWDGKHGEQDCVLGLGYGLAAADGEETREDGFESDVMEQPDVEQEVGGELKL